MIVSRRRAIPALLALAASLAGVGCASDGDADGDGTRHIRSIEELLAEPTPGVITPDKAFVEFPDDGENNDVGYPWMVPLDDDRWFCVFYHGRGKGPCSIYALDLTREDLV